MVGVVVGVDVGAGWELELTRGCGRWASAWGISC